MKKVYCRDCKFFRPADDFIRPDCEYVLWYKDEPDYPVMVSPDWEKQNKNNNCNLYKPSMWHRFKIWWKCVDIY